MVESEGSLKVESNCWFLSYLENVAVKREKKEKEKERKKREKKSVSRQAKGDNQLMGCIIARRKERWHQKGEMRSERKVQEITNK